MGSNYDPSRNDYWSLTLGVEYVIWDWGIQRRSSDVVIRGTRLRENEVYQEMRNAQNEVDLVRQRIKVARRVYSSRSLLLGDERESFGLISRDFREGRINFIDYVSSLRSFGRAELSLFEGLVELNKAYFEILLHKGKLDDYFKVN
jgi:outer membrane protein TolC